MRPAPIDVHHVLLLLTVVVVTVCSTLFAGVEVRVVNSSVIALVALALLALLPVARGRAALTRDPVMIGWALIVGSALLTLPYSVNRYATLELVIRLVGYALTYGLIRYLPRSRRASLYTLYTLLSVAFLNTIYGLWSTLGHKGVVLWLQKTAYVDSVTGTFINRSHFAAFLGLHLLTALGLFVRSRGRTRWLLGGALTVGFFAQGLTLSRGGLAATGLAIPVFLWLLNRADRRRLYPLVGASLVALVAFVITNGDGLTRRLQSVLQPTTEFSSAARLSMWKSTLKAATDAPLLGFGAGTFESFYPRYRDPGINRLVTYAHQDYLELCAEQGIVGLAIVAIALGLICSTLLRAVGNAGDERPVVTGITAGLLLIAAHAMVDFPLKIPAVVMTASAMLGLALRLSTHDDNEVATFSPSSSRRLATILAIVLTVVAARATQSVLGDRQVRRAEAAFDAPWTESTLAYTRATAIDPWDPRGFAGLAHAEMNRAKFQTRNAPQLRQELAAQALEHMAMSEQLDSMKGDYNLQRAWLFNFLTRYADAAVEYELAVADDPANANLLFHAGSFFLHRHQLGQTDRGYELIRKAVHTFPKLFGGKIHELHYLLHDVDRLRALVPEDQPFLLFQLASYLLEQAKGEEKAAIATYRQAASLSDWPEGWVQGFTGAIAQSLVRDPALVQSLGAFAAIELAEATPVERRTANVEYHIAKLYANADRQDDAIRTMTAACARHPGDRELLRHLIRFAGDSEATRTALEQYRQASGEDVGLYVAQGFMALARGDREAARTAFAAALKLAPDDHEALAGARQAAP